MSARRGKGRAAKQPAARVTAKKNAPPSSPPALPPRDDARQVREQETPHQQLLTDSQNSTSSTSSEFSSRALAVMKPASILPNMPTDELIRKLKLVSTQFQNMKQQEDTEYEELIPFCLHLADDNFLHHRNPDVQLLVACSIADVLRIYAPEAPYKDNELVKNIFRFLIRQLEGLRNTQGLGFKRYFYLLENLSFVKCFEMCFELEDEECQDIFIALFNVIFSNVMDSHSDKVRFLMCDLLAPLITDGNSLSYELLDALLKNIVDPLKSSRKAACQLAKQLILRCMEALEPYISSLLNGVLIGNLEEDEDVLVARSPYDLIYELYDLSPSLVTGSLPQMEYKLKSLDKKERLEAVTLLAKIFSDKNSKLNPTNTPLWQAFIGRFNDVSTEIRTICVQHSMHFLLNHPESRKDIEDCLALRLHDSDEKVRLEVVKAVVRTATNNGFEYVSNNRRLLDCIKERTLDKKVKIRLQALEGLAEIYKLYMDQQCEGGPPVWIHDKILLGYYLDSMEERTLIERLINTCLVPYRLEVKDRMVQLLYLISTVDERTYRAFVETQKQLIVVRRYFQELCKCVRKPVPNRELQTKILNSRITALSKCHPRPAYGVEFITALVKDMKEKRILLDGLEQIANPTSDCKTVVQQVNAFLKRLGQPVEQNLYYGTIKLLLERGSSVLIDKEAIMALLTLVSSLVAESSQNDWLRCKKFPAAEEVIKKGCTLISALAFLFPDHFDSAPSIELMLSLLTNDNLDKEASSHLLSAFAYVGKGTKPLGEQHPILMNTLARQCETLIGSGSPRQGKMAVRCLHINLSKAEHKIQIFTKILKTIELTLQQSPNSSGYPTAIVALGHIALLMPVEFKLVIRDLIRLHIVKQVLLNPTRSPQDSLKNLKSLWCEQEQLPVPTRCMVYGMKTLARWLVGLQTDVNAALKTFKMLIAFVENGGSMIEDEKMPFTNSEKAWIRLAAGSSLLKIIQQKGVGDQYTATQFCILAQLMNDGVDQVRIQFAAKLHKGLSKGIPDKCLPLDFLGFYCLAGFEPTRKHKATLKRYMNTDVTLRRDYIKLLLVNHPDKDKAAEQLPYLMPDYMLAFSVAILSNNPHFQNRKNVDELNDVRRCLQFVLDPLVAKNGDYCFGFFKGLLQGIKNRRNAADSGSEDANLRMYTVCDMVLELLWCHGKFAASSELEPPNPPRISTLYFTSHQDPLWVNMSSYLSDEYVQSNQKRKAVASPGKTPKAKPAAGPVAGPSKPRGRQAKGVKRGREQESEGEGDRDPPEEVCIDAAPMDAKRARVELDGSSGTSGEEPANDASVGVPGTGGNGGGVFLNESMASTVVEDTILEEDDDDSASDDESNKGPAQTPPEQSTSASSPTVAEKESPKVVRFFKKPAAPVPQESKEEDGDDSEDEENDDPRRPSPRTPLAKVAKNAKGLRLQERKATPAAPSTRSRRGNDKAQPPTKTMAPKIRLKAKNKN